MGTIFLIIVWLAFSSVVAGAAEKRGRSRGNWFLLSLLISPVIAALFLVLSGNDDAGLARSGAMRKCPKCAEMVKREASLCRFCHSELEALPQLPAAVQQVHEVEEASPFAVIIAIMFVVGAIIIMWLAFN